ncbi:MAG TPA: NADPH-dependent F420 reductase, partial [Bryobacteraceae bacterium]|nr:NADPH-dependent F420 reductase [Bryobacteraceae bacterium]
MSYAILGAGKVGQALATAFARKGIEVAIASRRPVEALAPVAKAIGPTVVPKMLRDAVKAEIVFLAVPFETYKEVAKVTQSWQDKIVIDVTNAYGVPPEKLGNLPSSVVISKALPGARLVKAFNHLPAETLAEDPNVVGGRRVIFLSSDDQNAAEKVAKLVERLGFAPVWLGRLKEGGLLVLAQG